jgi:hypothetical protein
MVGIEGDIRLALWPAFIGDVHVGAHAQRRGGSRAAVGPAVEQMLIFIPPARSARIQSLRAGKLGAEYGDKRQTKKDS